MDQILRKILIFGHFFYKFSICMFLWDLRPGVKQSYAIKQEILIWHHQASS